MSASFSSGLIQNFFTRLDKMLDQFVYQGYSALADHLRAPLGAAVVLIIVMLGISITQGWVKLSISNFIKLALKIGLVYTFAMNWDLFSKFVVQGIAISAGDIGDWIINSAPHNSLTGDPGINGALQHALNQFTNLGSGLWAEAGLRNEAPYLGAFIVWLFGYALVFISVLEIVIAKVIMALLFTLAPLFIGFTLFKPTYHFFDRWLGIIAGSAFLLIFISALLALILNFVEWTMNDLNPDFSRIQLGELVPALFICFIGVGLVFRVTHMAQAIGGGITTSSGNALVAGAVGGAIGGTIASAKPVGKMVNMIKGIGKTSDKINL